MIFENVAKVFDVFTANDLESIHDDDNWQAGLYLITGLSNYNALIQMVDNVVKPRWITYTLLDTELVGETVVVARRYSR